jgi:hypothetical protein
MRPTDIRRCYIAHRQPGGQPYFSNSLPIGTTRTSAKIISFLQTTNVASLFDRFGGRYTVGALLFSPILKIGPSPTAPPRVD